MTSNIKPYPSYDEKAFSKDVIANWGNINNSLIDDENLLHPQMAHLGRTISESFKEGDGSIGKEILEFLNGVLANDDAILEIENAVAISFLEYSDFEELGILNNVPGAILKIVREQKERLDNAT
jgi:hypothetical protein